MVSASLIAEARRRAGLSQTELARRIGTAHANVSRWEHGRSTPSLERLREIVAACGLELTLGLATADDSYDAQIGRLLPLRPRERLERQLDVAEQSRRARAIARGGLEERAVDVAGVLRALVDAGVAFVLIGEIAAAAHGAPTVPASGSVAIVPRAGERDRLDAAIAAGGGRPVGEPAALPVDAVERAALEAFGAELRLEPAPAGTRGYEDLRRDARPLELVDGVLVPTASLLDLVRIAEASTDPGEHASVVALRRTLELSTTPPRKDSDAA